MQQKRGDDRRSSLAFMPRLDGLRAIAILGVLFEHFSPLAAIRAISPGGAGVSLFFVVSGYLITRILMQYQDREIPKVAAALHFYARRLLRLSPPYYLAIAASFMLGIDQMRESWWIHALYLSNVQLALAGHWLGGADHFWSLATEEQFYILWFVGVVALPRRFLPRLVLLAFVITFAFRSAVYFLRLDPVTTVLLPGNIATLAMGALIAYLGSSDRLVRFDRLFLDRRLLLLSGAAFTLLSFSLHLAYAPNAFLYPFLAAAFFACVVRIAVEPRGNRWFDWLSWAPLRHIGKISYGIYVYHIFVHSLLISLIPSAGIIIDRKGWSAFLILAASSILVAEISWYAMEKPILKLKPALPISTGRSYLRQVFRRSADSSAAQNRERSAARIG